MTTTRLMPDFEVKGWRERVAKKVAAGWFHTRGAVVVIDTGAGVDQFGDTEIIDATGRATCRECGAQIKKGQKAFRGSYDFQQGGSWTAIGVQIHADENDCHKP